MWVVCLGIAGAVFLGDLWIKAYVEKRCEEGEGRALLRGRILLRKCHNRGMILHLGQRRRRAVAVLSLLLTLVVLAVFLCTLGQKGNTLLKLGLSFLLGGAFSNTYDRLRRKYVVDYLSFGVRWKWLRRIVFNLSDFCIMAGAVMTALGAV